MTAVAVPWVWSLYDTMRTIMGVAKRRGLLKAPPRGLHVVIVPIVSFILSGIMFSSTEKTEIQNLSEHNRSLKWFQFA